MAITPHTLTSHQRHRPSPEPSNPTQNGPDLPVSAEKLGILRTPMTHRVPLDNFRET
jgi:hypothetical protein